MFERHQKDFQKYVSYFKNRTKNQIKSHYYNLQKNKRKEGSDKTEQKSDSEPKRKEEKTQSSSFDVFDRIYER